MKWLKILIKFFRKRLNLSAKSQHQRYRLHSQLNSSAIRNYAKMRAREPMLININEGIATGDVVRVFNDRGEI